MGRSYAYLLARRGAQVVVNDLGGSVSGGGASKAAADKVAAEIRDAGGEAVANHDSVATADGAKAIIQSALDAFGTVDIVVNNAGIVRSKPFEETTTDDFNSIVEVHLFGAFFVSVAAFPVMKAKRHGRLIFVTSIAGMRGAPGNAAYSAAKAGEFGLANTLALEGAAHGVKVNTIAPFAYTRMTHDVVAEQNRQLLDPEFIAPIVVYLASDECQVSHETFAVGGGTVSRYFVGMTQGLRTRNVGEMTPEAVRNHIEHILTTQDFVLPPDDVAETRFVLGRRRKPGHTD